MPDLEQLILSKLAVLNPINIELVDESHKHVGHAGVLERGGRHYHLSLTIDKSDDSNAFNQLGLLKQHQEIYRLLDGLVGKEIHALRITIKS